MDLKRAFTKGATLAFKIFKKSVKNGYLVIINDTGFSDATETPYPVRIIVDNFTKEDAEQSSFYDMVQPTDIKGLILGEEIPVEIKTVDLIRIGDVDYSIVEYDTDPYEVLYTLLLRASK